MSVVRRTPRGPGRVPHGQGQHLWVLTPFCLDGSWPRPGPWTPSRPPAKTRSTTFE